MFNALNFRNKSWQDNYYEAYDKTLQMWNVEYSEIYINTSFGKSHCLLVGNVNNPPLILLHAAGCSSTIWYPNVKALSQDYSVYAIDLIKEASKSTLLKPIKKQEECAKWLNETLNGLDIKQSHLISVSSSVLINERILKFLK
jgi:pimeloyl-ACP methyl ester carboxylesterase